MNGKEINFLPTEHKERLLGAMLSDPVHLKSYRKYFWDIFYQKLENHIPDIVIEEQGGKQVHHYKGKPFAQTMIMPIVEPKKFIGIKLKNGIVTIILQGIDRRGLVINELPKKKIQESSSPTKA